MRVDEGLYRSNAARYSYAEVGKTESTKSRCSRRKPSTACTRRLCSVCCPDSSIFAMEFFAFQTRILNPGARADFSSNLT